MNYVRADRRSGQRLSSHCRRGFTIFELVIVLVILATIVAISWPAVEKFYTEYRLRQGGQLIQARMAGARVHAVDTGIDYQFRFEPGGQRFLVLPYDPQALTATSSGTTSATNSSGGGGTQRIPKIAGRLPSSKAQFDTDGAAGSTVQTIPSEWLSGIRDASDLNGVNWSAPILFHADGSATTAQVIIRDKKSRFVTVSVRALTGGVSVSKIENGGTR